MKMIPDYMDRSHSNAEAKIFKRLEAAEGFDGWFCLHSLGLSRHINKREGELDFVLVGSAGIFVIEVKGGRVSREGGKWKFTDRNGITTTKNESPFEQAKTGMYSLLNDIKRQFGFNHSICYGYGAAFPDIEFTLDSPEWDKAIIFDVKDVEAPISEYLYRLTSFWKNRSKGVRTLSPTEVKELVSFLRGDFESIRPLSLDLVAAENVAIQLTQEQYICLDAMAENSRSLFMGPAGTGKTLLAVEQARRMAAQGINTLYLCYNSLLAAFIGQLVQSEGLSEFIDVKTVHAYIRGAIIEAGFETELKNRQATQDESALFDQTYPELFTLSKSSLKTYDHLVIDEGQDVLTDNYVQALDLAIDGGLDSGSWSIFLDPENQKNLFDKLSQDTFQYLKQHSASYRLTINCRNTKPIISQVETVTGFAAGAARNPEGPKVRYKFYENSFEESVLVGDLLRELLNSGVKPKDILILSPKAPSISIAGSGQLRVAAPLAPLSARNVHKRPDDLITYASIQSSKGLESPIIILTDIEQLESDWDKTVTYVGYTRAKALLLVVANKKIKATLLGK